MLPPAVSGRDVAAEAIIAASLLRKDSRTMLSSPEQQLRPLVMAVVCDSTFTCLVGELIQHVESGLRAGSSWIKPIAIRSAHNVSLAVRAEEYDCTLGWTQPSQDAAAQNVPSSQDAWSDVHLFSPLVHNAFIPTAELVDVPGELSLIVRTLAESHAAALAADEGALDAANHSKDFDFLHAFMSRIALGRPGTREGRSGFYDPLG